MKLTMGWSLVVFAMAMCGLSGCTMVQLQKNTVAHAESISVVYQRQVLDNVAHFVVDPYAVPSFAFSDQGTTSVNDELGVNPTTTWNRVITGGIHGWASQVLGLNAKRAASGNWVLKPVNDPRRLDLMRCAYQQAVACCCTNLSVSGCPDCERRWNTFYTGDPLKPIPYPGEEKDRGLITPHCLAVNGCWFETGSWKDIPKGIPTEYVGRYEETYVWVPPGGRDTFAKLTLIILDCALTAPAAAPTPPIKRTKEVTAYLMANGTNATEATAERIVRAVVPIDADVEAGVRGVITPEDKVRASERVEKEAADLIQMKQEIGALLEQSKLSAVAESDINTMAVKSAFEDLLKSTIQRLELDALSLKEYRDSIESITPLGEASSTLPEYPIPPAPAVSQPLLQEIQLRLDAAQGIPGR